MDTNLETMVESMNEKNIALETKLKELQAKLSIMDTYKQVVDYIGVEEKIENIIQIITDVVIGVLGVSYCAVSLYDDKGDRTISEYKISKDIVSVITNENISEFEIELKNNKGFIVIKDLKLDKYLNIKEGAFLALGLVRGDKFHGLMAIYYLSSDYLDNSKIEFFQLIGSQLVLHIENAKLFNKLRESSITDELSGLHNRIYMNEILLKNQKLDYDKVAIIIMDIDNFKKINDTYGHIFGDKVIVAISDILKKIQKKYDVNAFRFGGEEFLVYAENKSLENLNEIAEDIRTDFMNTYFDVNGEKVNFTISLGGCKFGVSSKVKDIGKIIEDADTALYYSKSNGKNRYTFSNPNMQMYMNSKNEFEKICSKGSRKISKYYLFKISFQQEFDTLEEYRTVFKILRDTYRLYDFVFSNSMVEFLVVLEGVEVQDGFKYEERITTILQNAGYSNFNLITINHDFDKRTIKDLFEIKD